MHVIGGGYMPDPMVTMPPAHAGPVCVRARCVFVLRCVCVSCVCVCIVNALCVCVCVCVCVYVLGS